MACDSRTFHLRRLNTLLTRAQNQLFDLDNSLTPVVEAEHEATLKELGLAVVSYLGTRGISLFGPSGE